MNLQIEEVDSLFGARRIRSLACSSGEHPICALYLYRFPTTRRYLGRLPNLIPILCSQLLLVLVSSPPPRLLTHWIPTGATRTQITDLCHVCLCLLCNQTKPNQLTQSATVLFRVYRQPNETYKLARNSLQFARISLANQRFRGKK